MNLNNAKETEIRRNTRWLLRLTGLRTQLKRLLNSKPHVTDKRQGLPDTASKYPVGK